MSEQLNFFNQLYGDVVKHWDEGEKNDCGVYVKNTHIYKAGSHDKGCELKLEMCKKDGKLLCTHSLSFCDYGRASPLSDHSESISVERSVDDVCRCVRKYLWDAIVWDVNIDKCKKQWNILRICVGNVVDMLRTDLTTNKRNNDEEQTDI